MPIFTEEEYNKIHGKKMLTVLDNCCMEREIRIVSCY